MKNKLKENRGITLIALIVTVIVLLILAAVSLRLVLGQNGVIDRTKNSKTEIATKTDEEQLQLWASDYAIKHNGSSIINEAEVAEDITIDDIVYKYITTDNGSKFIISNDDGCFYKIENDKINKNNKFLFTTLKIKVQIEKYSDPADSNNDTTLIIKGNKVYGSEEDITDTNKGMDYTIDGNSIIIQCENDEITLRYYEIKKDSKVINKVLTSNMESTVFLTTNGNTGFDTTTSLSGTYSGTTDNGENCEITFNEKNYEMIYHHETYTGVYSSYKYNNLHYIYFPEPNEFFTVNGDTITHARSASTVLTRQQQQP